MPRTVDRRSFLASLAATALPAQPPPARPNILFILADDLGYGDLGCYGQQRFATPRLDKLAAEGIRFTQAYAGSTVCAPSRCCLMTGHHTGHARIRGNAKVDLLPEDLTVARLLKRSGYRTSLIGKWGLGTAGNSGIPNRQGFDQFFGFLDQRHAHTQFPTQLWNDEEEWFADGNFGPDRKDYAQEIFIDRAVKYLKTPAPEPYFLYLALTIPHANNEMFRQTGNGMELPAAEVPRGKPWPQPDQNFAATVERLDRDVGRVLDALRESGQERNTMVLFSSDNGPHKEGGNDPEFFDSNGPLRGIKRDLYEGGVRVPALARWTGRIAPAQVSDQIWAFWDFLPTAAELAGAPAPACDGLSLVPALTGKKLPEREFLYWEFHERGFSQAVRQGKWKAVRRLSRRHPVELYDLETDIGEAADIAASNPEVAKRLAAMMDRARTESQEFPIREANE